MRVEPKPNIRTHPYTVDGRYRLGFWPTLDVRRYKLQGSAYSILIAILIYGHPEVGACIVKHLLARRSLQYAS